MSDIVEAIDIRSEELTAYLYRKTGEIVTVSEEDVRAAEEGKSLDDYPEWQRENICRAGDILEHEEDYITLPDTFDFHEYHHMEKFCLTLNDREASETLYRALKGKEAFRRFKDALERYDLIDTWYVYRAEALRQFAIDGCEANNVAFQDK